jgi:two-component system LytT family response regulator
MRVLLVDDEEPARARLRQLLNALADIQVVGEAEDGEQALEKILELRPDLVFLDIQMPGCGGMEVAASLPSPRPKIIFCTAYDQYAVDAFEVHAVDYLLKPVNRARLAAAVERVRELTTAAADASLEKAGRSTGTGPTRFLAKRGSRYHVVPADQVACFTSEEGLTRLEAGEQHFWMQPTLNDLERRIDPAAFFRVSRSAIVRLDAVREVLPQSGGYGEVLLSNGSRLEVSRRRFRPLMDKLAG